MSKTKKVTISGLLIALGMVLPLLTGQIPEIGGMLLPMHFPVLICGYACGWQYGIFVGFVLPLLRSVIFGVPVLMPKAVVMAFELAAYGGMAGLLYQNFSKNLGGMYKSLAGAMIGGRLVKGIAAIPIYGMAGSSFGIQMYLTGTFLEAIPGIILQFLLIPAIILSLQKAKVLENNQMAPQQ